MRHQPDDRAGTDPPLHQPVGSSRVPAAATRRPAALDAYQAHGRIIPGTLVEHLDTIADYWIEHHARGDTTAITTTTNDHVDAINHHIQQRRVEHGDLDPTWSAPIADGEALVGDIVATRRNDRHLHTSSGDTVRNRELWTITDIGTGGDLTVTQVGGHGTVTLPADYVREHVRLGYAATEPGNQSDTETGSITLATPATTGRGLYVAMTRGEQENLVLGPSPKPTTSPKPATSSKQSSPATAPTSPP